MQQKLMIVGLAALAPAAVTAQPNLMYDCTSRGAVRQVEVAYPSGGAVPCEVRYYKDGAPEVLWSADHQTGYCEDQARTFVEHLQSLGWMCVERGTAATPESRDDTDVLGAGDR